MDEISQNSYNGPILFIFRFRYVSKRFQRSFPFLASCYFFLKVSRSNGLIRLLSLTLICYSRVYEVAATAHVHKRTCWWGRGAGISIEKVNLTCPAFVFSSIIKYNTSTNHLIPKSNGTFTSDIFTCLFTNRIFGKEGYMGNLDKVIL